MLVHMYVWTLYICIMLHSFFRKIVKIVYKPVLSLLAFSLPQASVISVLCLEFEDSVCQKCGSSPCPEKNLSGEGETRQSCCIEQSAAGQWLTLCFSKQFICQWPWFYWCGDWVFVSSSFCCVEPAARALPVLEPAVIKRSLLISQEHPGQPSLLSGWKSWGWSLFSEDQVCPWEAGSIGGFTLGLLGGFGRAALLVQISHPWIGRNEICLCVSAQ